ncbi:PAS domain-containing sensor histidine kinase [Legionella sp.]|uniref:PAS domain-containing sensor histidine kinase n=1 Tax=Legionella sp. TaxID=459 RepID=UPI003CBEEEC4
MDTDLTFILDQSVGNLYWKDLKGKYKGANQTFLEMIGLNSILGKSDRDLFLDLMGEEKIKLIETIDQRIMTTGIEETLEEEGINKKGNKAYYFTKKIPLRDKAGKIIGLMGTSLDIPKEKQADIAYDEFLKNISHDITTPFCGLYSIAEILTQNERLDPETRELADYIKISADALLTFLKQALEINHLNAKCIEISEFNIREIVEEIYNLLLAEIKRKNLTVNIDCPNNLVQSDYFRISRILMNLMGNAVKFTEQGFIHVHISITPHFTITVQDSGIGIPKEQTDVIFQKFTKLKSSYQSNVFTGSGMGLYLTKQMVEELGGHIQVKSHLGKGSIFTCIFSKKSL